MSSRVYAPDDGINPEPLLFRRIGEKPAAAGPPPEERETQLRKEYEARIQEARAAGVREGQAAAREQAAAELRAVMERTARSIAEVASLRHRLRREAESDLVQLAMAIARRILHRELAVDAEAMRGLIVAALERLQAREITRVRTCPGHVALLRTCLEKLSAERIEVLPDPAMPAGGIVFETQRGNLDASVDVQLDEIGRGLADRLKKGHVEWNG